MIQAERMGGVLINARSGPDLKRLDDPFPAEDIEWRLDQVGRGRDGRIWARVVRYVTARGVAARLDEVVGKENWRTSFHPLPNSATPAGAICRLELRLNGEWVAREDGAPNTQIEAIKGGLSDAFKRAAVQWGIGRWLYGGDQLFAETYPPDDKRGRFRASANVKDASGREERVWFRWSPPAERPPAETAPPPAPKQSPPARQSPAKSRETLEKKLAARVRELYSEARTPLELIAVIKDLAETKRHHWPDDASFRAAISTAAEECQRFAEGDRGGVITMIGHYLRPLSMQQQDRKETSDGEESQTGVDDGR